MKGETKAAGEIGKTLLGLSSGIKLGGDSKDMTVDSAGDTGFWADPQLGGRCSMLVEVSMVV